jgi:hypothetical protein
MATFNDQVLRVWDEWEATTGADANNPDDFLTWALENRKLFAQPQDVRRMLRKQVTVALRQALRTDEDGITYRAKQCVIIFENGGQIPLWFDTDNGGTSNLRQKAVRQRRDRIADNVYRAVSDVDHMKKAFPNEQFSFDLNFADDYAERCAVGRINNEEDDDDESAAN